MDEIEFRKRVYANPQTPDQEVLDAAGNNPDYQKILDQTQAGDHVQLQPGQYLGNFVINQSIELSGTDAILDAQGTGHGLLINAEKVTIDSLRIINWGDDLTEQNAGIYSDKKSNNIIIKNCHSCS